MIKYVIFLFLIISLFSCKNEVIPKPKAMLRLEYPKPSYSIIEESYPFTFELNELANVKNNDDYQLEVVYPRLKATIHITYKEVKNNIDSLLRDAEKLTFDHVVKADDIQMQPFENGDSRVYGKLFEVAGDAASQAQFYITDSTRHFLTGSLYFNVKPNYDSIFPAADYLKEDMRRMVESLRWQ
ncbi:gliding motility lipoprotein GldD [Flavobacteriaceae bacterium R38]|nr:gliding motility lipoprotein GldD [Flavobacteriaceae bacterium R38]